MAMFKPERIPYVPVPWANIRDHERRIQTLEVRATNATNLSLSGSRVPLQTTANVTSGSPNPSATVKGFAVADPPWQSWHSVGSLIGDKVFLGRLLNACSVTLAGAPIDIGSAGFLFPKSGLYDLLGTCHELLGVNSFDISTCGLSGVTTASDVRFAILKVHVSTGLSSEYLPCTATPLVATNPNSWVSTISNGLVATNSSGGVPTNPIAPALPFDMYLDQYMVNATDTVAYGEHLLEIGADANITSTGGYCYGLFPYFEGTGTLAGTNVWPRINLMQSYRENSLTLSIDVLSGPIRQGTYYNGVLMPAL